MLVVAFTARRSTVSDFGRSEQRQPNGGEGKNGSVVQDEHSPVQTNSAARVLRQLRHGEYFVMARLQ